MAKFKPQMRRLMHISRAIRDGERRGKLHNARTLAHDYGEVSEKTIQRDLEYLRDTFRAPIAYDKRAHGYYLTQADWSMPLLRISESELFAICIAEKALENYKNTPLHGKLVTIFEKIGASLGDDVSIEPSWVDSRFSLFREPSTTISPAIWETAFTALRESRTLQVEYQTPGSPESHNREINPYHAVSYRGEWYIVGHCHYRNEIRIFAISRMKKATILGDTFTIPKSFNFKKFAGTHFGIMRGEKEYKVKIRFIADQAPYVQEREWHPTQKIKKHKDGSITLSFATNSLFEVRRWILGWGSAATVLSPKELVEDVKGEMKKALRTYPK